MRQPVLKTATKPRYLYTHTFGCQMNDYDSLRVRGILASEGYSPVSDMNEADVIFLNTCSVREKAEQKVYSFLGRLRHLKTSNPDLKIVVGGCLAQQLGNRLLEKFDYLDLVLGTRAVPSIARLLHEVRARSKRLVHLPDLEDESGYELLPGGPPCGENNITAPVTIMQGCNNFCTYCIVPYVRGRERSRPSSDIIRDIKSLTESGTREILLLGQNVNSYGQGLDEKTSFVDLLHRIQSETNVVRVRFTTSHPKDLTDGLIQCFADLPCLCSYLHLPFQAGSDRILGLMNRGYTAAGYIEKIERLREVCPGIALSSDAMVGFPGESHEEFMETIRLIEKVRFDNLFSFRYSDRPYAKSCDFPDKVDNKVKAGRLLQLQSLQAEIVLSKNEAEVGRVLDVLVEGSSRSSNGQLTGRTSQNKIVNFEGGPELIGLILPVKMVAAYAHSLKGELLLI